MIEDMELADLPRHRAVGAKRDAKGHKTTTSRTWTWPMAAFRSVACPPRRPRATARRRSPWRP